MRCHCALDVAGNADIQGWRDNLAIGGCRTELDRLGLSDCWRGERRAYHGENG